ncbi:hypothetical protein BJY18_001798 [Amycolatopsis jiangsuensis]|uniref:Uncharacterized protein n=1 Tax=Amycolatopsis jiangsuensis TaxID=1181879 RepID=A0A840IR55_9PSEU|nr:hypothetical protein [Amycolatopsis jiangsuensis]
MLRAAVDDSSGGDLDDFRAGGTCEKSPTFGVAAPRAFAG